MDEDRVLKIIKVFSRAHTTLNDISVNAEFNLRRENEYNKVDLLQLIPAVVLLAFTVEICIKALIYKDTKVKAKKIHNLSELFRNLKDHRKARVINYVCKKNSFNEDEFYEHLEVSTSAFIEWRYVFDPDKEDIQVKPKFLRDLEIALQKEVGIPNNNSLHLY